jgi:hypothetical protein
MVEHSVARLGAIVSLPLALLYPLMGVTYAFLPADQRVVGVGRAEQYYASFLASPTAATLLYWETAAMGALEIATVMALSDLVRRYNEGLVRWLAYIASFGFVVTSIDSFLGLTLVPMRAEAFLAGDASTRAAIGATRLTLDYHGWYGFGGVGLWLLAVGILAWRSGALPRLLCLVGVLGAIGYFATVACFVGSHRGLLSAGIIADTFILIPVWHAWSGLCLWRIAGRPYAASIGASGGGAR